MYSHLVYVFQKKLFAKTYFSGIPVVEQISISVKLLNSWLVNIIAGQKIVKALMVR
jgi:hypothetical protein